MHFQDLTDEFDIHILEYLDTQSLANFSKTCRLARQITFSSTKRKERIEKYLELKSIFTYLLNDMNHNTRKRFSGTYYNAKFWDNDSRVVQFAVKAKNLEELNLGDAGYVSLALTKHDRGDRMIMIIANLEVYRGLVKNKKTMFIDATGIYSPPYEKFIPSKIEFEQNDVADFLTLLAKDSKTSSIVYYMKTRCEVIQWVPLEAFCHQWKVKTPMSDVE